MPMSKRSPQPRSAGRLRWLLAPNPWVIVPAAVLAGLLLFLAVWLVQRPPVDDEAAPAVLPTVMVQSARDPLPAPQDDGGATEGGVFVLPEAPAEAPATVAGTPPPPVPPAADAPVQAWEDAPLAGDSAPVPVHRPNPEYPSRALRRRLSGAVVVRAMVGIDGRPRQIEIARSSSHRALDQAALRAVRQWRFQPAMRAGQPVEQAVHIPFDFSP